MKANSGR